MNLHVVAGSVLSNMSAANHEDRLIHAAHEFEAQMLKELLKPLTAADGLTGAGSDDDSGEGSGGILGEFAGEALGKALSEQGGFGIANRIVRQLAGSMNRDTGQK